jgi:Bacterial TSP3 repeat
MFAAWAKAGIPEPDLVWYGKVLTSSGGPTVRLTTGTLVWQIEPLAGGPPIVIATALTNINDQFSFVLRVPCETPEPGLGASTNVINLTAPASRYRRVTVTLDGQPLSLISAPSEFSPLLTDRGRSERIDLRLGTAPVDSDGDGLADAWELQHFGNLNANAAGDPDGDGMSNLREFRAGTNPTDPSSRFEVVEISKVLSGISIQWTSQADRSYRVKRSPNLLAPLSEYAVVKSGLTATPPMNQFIDTTTGTNAMFFYLIEIEE